MATAREGRKVLEILRLPLGPRPPALAAKRAWMAGMATVALAVAIALGPGGEATRALAAAFALVLGAMVYQRLARRVRDPGAWLVVDERGLRRLDAGNASAAPAGKEARLADWSDGFGATVLARADRGALAVALTSSRSTRFVPVRVTGPEDRASAPMLLARATTVAESDLRIDDAASLSAADAERLLGAIAARVPGALDRVVLLDASGEPVVLDRGELRIGPRRIDLSSPLEWRAFAYQELGPNAAWLCQATWVRQGDAEVFLVAPMPADASSMRPAPDARLMPTGRGEPPPRELRRAIDHVFMSALRVALDRAPRLSRAPSAAPLTRPEGRA